MKSLRWLPLLLVLALAAFFVTAGTNRETKRKVWEDGYWAGATNGLESAHKEFEIARKRHGPLNADEMWPMLTAGLTNNPYQNMNRYSR